MLLAELTSPEIATLAPHTPVVVPVAAMEQHGRHLPLATDSMLLGEVVRRVEPRLGRDVLFAPLLWLGNSHHHLEYSGTLSAGPRTYLDLVNDLFENLLGHGFRRILFLNGHGGNITPAKQATFEVRQRHRARTDLLLLFASYWDFAHPERDRSDLAQSAVGHACEWETSMMLAIRPELVKPFERLEPRDVGYSFEPAYRGWITQERRPNGGDAPGHLGAPALASAEKGEFLLGCYADGVEAFLRRVVAWDGRSWEWPAQGTGPASPT
ncbi:MAG TPA: creatininase [Planctomycetaceae bacterium]|jgi:creatinine amidohydrolase|nr:creatininase [Planctomycetaceae bacterium]